MAFDGIVTGAMATELSAAITGGKIEKIYQPEKDELVFFIHTKSGKKKVYASCNNSHAGIYITGADYTNPPEPSGFCMLMRKHLVSARILSVSQKNAERIIEIEFETRDELGYTISKKLIVEIMGKHSNIILVDAGTNKILDSIKRVSIDVNRARQILPGRIYEYPPSQDKIPFNMISPQLLSRFTNDPDKLLSNVQGISPLIAREISNEPGILLSEIVTKLENIDLSPVVYLKEDKTPADFHVIHIKEYADRYEELTFETVSEAVLYYYSHRDSSNRIKQKSSDLSRAVAAALKKLYLKKQRLGEDLLKAERSDKYKLYGELLTANIHKVQTGDKSATLLNYYDNQEITIPLDERYAPSKNAQMYFKKYAKAKTAIKEKQIQLKETGEDILYLESVAAFIDSAANTEAVDALRDELTESGFLRKRKQRGLRKKRKIEPYEYFTSDGNRILAGRNNNENDQLTFKTAGRHDLWFHTKDIPGSHVILFTEGKPASDAAIFETAAIAAYHSKGKDSENVPVDYTEVRYVKKPNGAKPGMCIFTDNQTVFITPKLPAKEKV